MKKSLAVLTWFIVAATMLYWVCIGSIRLDAYANGMGILFGALSTVALAIAAGFVLDYIIVEQK